MQYLRRISESREACFYAIEGDHQTAVKRWVVSTPSSRDVCNQPELLGCQYTTALRAAVTSALAQAPFRSLIESHPESRVCVLNFLRGGLNFGLRHALHEAYGFNAHTSAFMSSQRFRVDGRWQVHEDMYRKLQIPAGALIVTGDVVATGVTVENGLKVLLDHLVSIGSSVQRLIFFTIGCHKLEKRLAEIDASFRQAFADYQECHAVYLEGKFRLVDSRTDLRIGLPGTDLIRRDCLLTPEFEASQYERLSNPLERCTIYDAGSRAFDVPSYAADVLEYWQQVADLANRGWTLGEALRERWPEPDHASRELYLKRRRALWQGVEDRQLEAIYARHLEQWSDSFRARAATSEALSEVAAERIHTLQSTLA
jgi:hypothetical protein